MKTVIAMLLTAALSVSAGVINTSQFYVGSKKKTPPKKEDAKPAGPKKITGELIGKIAKDKKDFKIYVLVTKDGKTWYIPASGISKIRSYYGRNVKLKVVYYSKDGKNIIEKIDSVSRA